MPVTYQEEMETLGGTEQDLAFRNANQYPASKSGVERQEGEKAIFQQGINQVRKTSKLFCTAVLSQLWIFEGGGSSA